MATITKPMALDESFNTTESISRNQADVLAGIEQAIVRGFGQVADAVSYDNTDSGLTADNVQDAIDEVDDTVDGLVDDVTEISSDIESTQTATGNPLTLTDCAPINAESLVVEFSPKQDLHGYDYPWVGGANIQLLPPQSSKSESGLTVTVDSDGTININGTASANVILAVDLEKTAESGKTYTVKAFSDVDSFANVEFSVRTANNTPDLWHVFNSQSYFTDIPDADCNKWQLQINNGGVFNNVKLKFMMVEGSVEPSNYISYSNICPITGYTECDVDDVGKNRVEETLSDTSIDVDGSIVSDSRYDMQIARVKQGVQYVVTTNDGGLVAGFFTEKPTSGSVSYNTSRVDTASITFTAPIDGYIAFRTYADYATPQCEEGSTATTYEPYHSSNATIQFGQTVYGGRSNFTEGGTDDEIAFIKDTHITNISEGVDGNADWLNVVFTIDIDILLSDTVEHRQILAERSMSNYSGDWEYENVNGHVHFYSGARAIYAFYPKSVFPTLSDFTTYYANNKAEFAIPYETASTISTPPTDLKLLQGTNNLSTNGTTITLGYQPDNVIGHTLEVAEDYTNRAVGKNILPMTLAGIKAANPHLTWTDETSFTSGNVTVTFQVAGGDIYGIHIVSTGSNGEFFNLCFDGADYSRFDGCILSGCDVNDENKIYIAIRKYGGANYFAKNISGDTVINYTAGQKASIFVYLSSGSVDTVLKPMIRKPNMDNTYEPPKPSKEILMDLIAYLFTQI